MTVNYLTDKWAHGLSPILVHAHEDRRLLGWNRHGVLNVPHVPLPQRRKGELDDGGPREDVSVLVVHRHVDDGGLRLRLDACEIDGHAHGVAVAGDVEEVDAARREPGIEGGAAAAGWVEGVAGQGAVLPQGRERSEDAPLPLLLLPEEFGLPPLRPVVDAKPDRKTEQPQEAQRQERQARAQQGELSPGVAALPHGLHDLDSQPPAGGAGVPAGVKKRVAVLAVFAWGGRGHSTKPPHLDLFGTGEIPAWPLLGYASLSYKRMRKLLSIADTND